MERYVVRDQAGNFFAEFASAADRFDDSGRTARDRALDWAALQQLDFSVWREDTTTAHRNVEPALIRRWPGQIIFVECLIH